MSMFRVGYFDEFLMPVPRLDKVGVGVPPGDTQLYTGRNTHTHREASGERSRKKFEYRNGE